MTGYSYSTTYPQAVSAYTQVVTPAPQYLVGSNAGLNTKELTYWQSPKRYKTHTPIEIAAQQFKHADQLAEQAKASFREVNIPHFNRPITYAVPHPVPTFVQTISHGQHGLLPAAAHMFQNISHSAPVIMGKQQLEQHIANLLQQIAILKQQHPDVAAALLKNVEAMIEKTAAASKTAFNVAV